MLLASCEEKSGKFVDALRNNAKALDTARTKGDASTMKTIAERVQVLLPKLAHVKFERPKTEELMAAELALLQRPTTVELAAAAVLQTPKAELL